MNLSEKTVNELREYAKRLNITGYYNLKKDELVKKIGEYITRPEDLVLLDKMYLKVSDGEDEVYSLDKDEYNKIDEVTNNKEKVTDEGKFNFEAILNKAIENQDKTNNVENVNINFKRESDFEDITNKKLQEIEAKKEELEEEKISKQKDMQEVVLEDGKKIRLNTETDKIVEGYVQILKQGYGFLRNNQKLLSTDSDIYIGSHFIDQFGLKSGDEITIIARENTDNKFPAAIYIISLKQKGEVSGAEYAQTNRQMEFTNLTPVYPYKRLVLENNPREISSRMIDLVSPIGLGQRALIVSPPKAGKTTLLKHIARSIKKNDENNNIELIFLLIDERPEEVTDIRNTITGRVYASTFDMTPNDHIEMAEKTLEEAKKAVVDGKDVVILLDSITRLARAYNIVEPSSGKILSGGFDPAALHKPKQFFGAARQTEEAGSLTIIATALVETGSKMDDFIFEEFKGTGNMEIVLERSLAESRIYPAINLKRSSTRKEELILSKDELTFMKYIRASFANKSDFEASKNFITLMKNYSTNNEMIEDILGQMDK